MFVVIRPMTFLKASQKRHILSVLLELTVFLIICCYKYFAPNRAKTVHMFLNLARMQPGPGA